MRYDLLDIIIKAKRKDNESIHNILIIFENIINKYSRLLDGEDTKQDLNLFLIKLINNINLDSNSQYNNKQLLSYISKSLKNEYIRLSKKKCKIHMFEQLDDDKITNKSINLDTNIEILDTLNHLTEYERWILSQIFFSGYTVNELSKTLRKSRQSVNQVKKRALDKLKIVI